MTNLLTSTEIAAIFLDNDLYVKRFTQPATYVVNLIPTDVGRPLSDIVVNLEYDSLQDDAHSGPWSRRKGRCTRKQAPGISCG
jgi:hypothetical protein